MAPYRRHEARIFIAMTGHSISANRYYPILVVSHIIALSPAYFILQASCFEWKFWGGQGSGNNLMNVKWERTSTALSM